MYEIITEAKATRTEADDSISMDTVKQIPYLMSSVLAHLINAIIRTQKFPDCLSDHFAAQ